MDIIEFLFLYPFGKYLIGLLIALFAIVANKLSDMSLKGNELFFGAPKISTGAVNWTMFTVGIGLASARAKSVCKAINMIVPPSRDFCQ